MNANGVLLGRHSLAMLGKGRRNAGDNVGGRKPDNPKDAFIAGILSAPLSVSPLPVTSPLEANEEMPTKRLCTRRQLTEQ